MELLKTWLEPYQIYLDASALLQALSGGADGQEQEEDDPALFFQDLVAGIDIQTFSAQTHNVSFTMGRGAAQAEGTPQAIVEMCTVSIKRTGRITALDAAKIAEAYALLKQYRSSEICTAAAFLLGNRSVETLSLLAGMAIREGLTEEAEEAVSMAEELHPDRPEPVYYRALLLVVLNKRASAAIDRLTRLTDEHPDYAPGWSLLLDICLAENLYSKAVEYGERAVELHPLDPLLWERLAIGLHVSNSKAKAAQAMRMALQRASESVGIPIETMTRLQLETAAFEEDAGFTAEAMARYRNLLETGRNEPAVFLNAASCMKARGLTRQALDLLRKGLEIHVDQPDLLTNMGEIFFEMEKDSEAFDCLQKAAEIEPDRSGNLLLMAAILLRRRKPEEALQLAEAVARADDERAAEAYALIGDVYRFSGADSAAEAAYEEADKRAPNNRDIIRRVNIIKQRNNGANQPN